MTLTNKKIKLFASSIPVKGITRSIICDIQRRSYLFIPNDLCDILLAHDGKSLSKIKEIYSNQFDSIIDDYFQFLFDKEHIFYTDIPNSFPKLSLEWYDPFEVNNAIIDVDENFDFDKILTQLNSLKCKFLEIRFWKDFNYDEVLKFVEKEKLIFHSIGFIIPYSVNIKEEHLKNLFYNYPRVAYFIITNTPEPNSIQQQNNKDVKIIYIKEKISPSLHCGAINSEYFVVNTKLFTESQHHNTCLNRKISIDKDGNIKNCPSMAESFGNIKDTTLKEALNKPGFKKYWNINKDQIEVCKDCEFRHICTDCRAYIEDPENQYSKPLKCGYNPYTNVWEEWSTNPLKQKAIEYYGMHDLVKKDLKT